MNQPPGEIPAPEIPDKRQIRLRFAADLRRQRTTIGLGIAQAMAARWRPSDVGTDLISGVVADECQRLVTTLAFAIEMMDPTLFCDEISWLLSMFQARGYDGARLVPPILDTYAHACRGLGPPALLDELVTPVLDAARRLVPPAPTGSPEPGQVPFRAPVAPPRPAPAPAEPDDGH